MIFAPLLLMGGAIMGLFATIFHALNWQFPPQIVSGIQAMFNLLYFWRTLLPFFADIFAIIAIILPAHYISFVIKIVRWIWAHVPFVGTNARLPGVIARDHDGYAIRQTQDNGGGMGTYEIYKRRKGKGMY